MYSRALVDVHIQSMTMILPFIRFLFKDSQVLILPFISNLCVIYISMYFKRLGTSLAVPDIGACLISYIVGPIDI